VPATAGPAGPGGGAPGFRRYPTVRAMQFVRNLGWRQPRHAARARSRLSTPLVLRAGMALLCVPIALFALAVRVGVDRNDQAVETVGQDATQGITLAQEIKLNLGELDEAAVHNLVVPAALGPSGFPEDYNAQRRELQASLVEAASEAPSSLAYQQRLQNIDYALGHYHALLRESFAASDRGDTEEALRLYGQAHTAMTGTLLPEADSFDKANTYVLNNTYERHTSDAASTGRWIGLTWVVLLAALVLAQVLLARRFRRIINVALAAATLIAALSGWLTIARLDDSSADLTTAREEAFDAVHLLARARATVVTAWQAEGQFLLDPSGTATAPASDPADAVDAGAPATEDSFAAEAAKLFRAEGDGDPVAAAQAAGRRAIDTGDVREGSGGYLATVIDAGVSPGGTQAAAEALQSLAGLLQTDAELRQLVASGDAEAARLRYEDGQAVTELADAIDRAQAIDQETFDSHAAAAEDATRNLGRINAVAVVAMVALVLAGFYVRLREYRS